jgi:hypothetical protein
MENKEMPTDKEIELLTDLIESTHYKLLALEKMVEAKKSMLARLEFQLRQMLIS